MLISELDGIVLCFEVGIKVIECNALKVADATVRYIVNTVTNVTLNRFFTVVKQKCIYCQSIHKIDHHQLSHNINK